jgi:hypothetical protein
MPTHFHYLDVPPEIVGLLLQLALIVLFVAGYVLLKRRALLNRRFPDTSKKALQTLQEFLVKARITRERVALPEVATVTRGYLALARLEGPYSPLHTELFTAGRSEVVADVPVEDLCREPPLVIKVRKKYSHAVIVVPAIRIASGMYKDVVISCFNTESIRAETWLGVTYSEGFAKCHLKIAEGSVNIKLEWLHHALESLKPQLKVRVEVCSEKVLKPHFKSCIPVIEASKPGVHEQVYRYPVTRRVLVTHASGALLPEALESVIGELPPLLAGRGVTIKLRVKRLFKTIAETSTTLS